MSTGVCRKKSNTVSVLAGVVLAACLAGSARGPAAEPANPPEPKNAMANPSFELGRDAWVIDQADGTVSRFALDDADSFDGRYSALVDVGAVQDWGMQLGQRVDAGRRDGTYTFCALAKSVGGPVTVGLRIERAAGPWDTVAAGSFTLADDRWTELHVTFKVVTNYPEGWFAYVGCTQPQARFRVDAFRLYEGEYVPFEQAAHQAAVSPAVRLFDTRASFAEGLPPDALAHSAQWAELPGGQTQHEFAGDALFLNDRVAVHLRRGAPGTEVCSLGLGRLVRRAILAPAVASGEPRIDSWEVLANGPDATAVSVRFSVGESSPVTLVHELAAGQVFVRTEGRGGAEALRVEAPCRFLVLPDFFADDIVVDADALGASEAELPSENFLLHMLDTRDAIVAAVWDWRGEDLHVGLSQRSARRLFDWSEVRFGPSGKVWVAVIEAPGVWHVHDVARGDAGRAVALDWKAPFGAAWRLDWRREDGLTDSWEMLTQTPSGGYVKPGWFGGPDSLPPDRRRWTTVLGWFQYPCWIDRAGRGHIQPFMAVLRFQGPALLYPINRTPATPLDVFTVVDLVRATLGVGPCEYILDVEGQAHEYKGMATCEARDTLNPIYQAGQQKQRRAEIEHALDAVMVFIRHIRGRIEAYVGFGHEMLAYLDAQAKASPQIAGPLNELAAFARAIDEKVDQRREAIKTPDYAAALVERFRQTMLDYEGPDAFQKCRQLTEALVEIGGNQDELVGECRWAVKVLRQRAALAAAQDPRLAQVAAEIRRRSQEVLRNPAGHEGARH